MPSLIEYKLEYLSRLFASLTHLPQALCTTTIMIMIIVIRVSFIVLMHTQNLNLKWVVTLNWLEVSKAYVVYDISSTLFFMHKPMEHANMCSKLSVFEQGRIKTCASLSRPLQLSMRDQSCNRLFIQVYIQQEWPVSRNFRIIWEN